MKIEIINAEELQNLYLNHGLFACTCYDTSDKYAEKVGKSCNKEGHWSGSRTEYIKFRIYDIDRGTAEQMMRHEIDIDYDNIDKYSFNDKIEILIDINPNNIVKNMQSFRYVDKNEFTYYIPSNINKSERALNAYNLIMKNIDIARKEIREILIQENICDIKQAVEDANFVLPRATNLTLTIGFTPEALIQFMWKRLCIRSQEPIRKVALEMKKIIHDILPEFAENQLVPHCQHLLWCPEGKNRTCGAYPNKETVKNYIKGMESQINPKTLID